MTNEQIKMANELQSKIKALDNEIDVLIDDMFLCNLISYKKVFGLFAKGRKVEFRLSKEEVRAIIDIKIAEKKRLEKELKEL